MMLSKGKAQRIPHDSLDLQTLDVEDELGVRRDPRDALLAVAKVGGYGEPSLSAGADALYANVPTLNDFSDSELEAERLPFLVCYSST